jgi:hypothetical protein
MPETRSIASVLEAAETAASGGDYPAAGRLLREAAALQEAALGPQHPDLANTLNNLGIVCEMTNEPAEAERSYRRAYEIASVSLPADHPFVATSLKNLNDFRAAKGFPTEAAVDTTPGRAAAVPDAPVVPKAAPVKSVPVEPAPVESAAVESRPPEPTGSFPRWVLAVLALAAIAVIAYVLMRGSAAPAVEHATGSTAKPAPESNVAEVSPAPQPAPETPAAAPAPPPARSGRTATPPPAPTPAPTPARTGPVPAPFPAASSNRDAKPGDAALSIVDAAVCRDLTTGGGEWKCTRVEGAVEPGRLFFYTRVKSPTDTVVEHRWYQGDKLRHTGEMKISANTSEGYRTYSRFTIDARSTGSWRVEVRTKDGHVLREARFDVR